MHRHFISSLMLLAVALQTVAQEDITAPNFPGGVRPFIAQNLNYPASARDNGISGRVEVRFVVSESGDVSDIRVANSVHPTLDSEVVRVVRLMPKWKPAIINGHPVKAFFTLPVSFSVEDRDVPMRLAKASDARKYSRLPDWRGHLDQLPPIVIQTETKAEAAALPSTISVLAMISADGLVLKPLLFAEGDKRTRAAILSEASKFWSAQAAGPLFTPAIRKRDGRNVACEVLFDFPVQGVVE